MSQTGPWSVKGIDQRARDAAREAAHAEGITLGEYLNRLLMSVESSKPNEVAAPFEHRRPAPNAANDTIDKLTRRIEATEARSTLAITGMDHTILGLVARLEDAEQSSSTVASRVDGFIEELQETYAALQAKVQKLEDDDSSRENLEALKSLEQALGKLASHVFEENELAQNEALAVKGRVETGFAELNDRVEGMEVKVEKTLAETASRIDTAVSEAEQRAETQSREFTDRLSDLETHVNLKLSGIDRTEERLSAAEARMSESLNSVNAALDKTQDRLNRAESTTDAALLSLESTLNDLDVKIGSLSRSVEPDMADKLRAEFESRFEQIMETVRQSVDTTRRELAEEISKAAAAPADDVFEDIRSEIDSVRRTVSEDKERQSSDIQSVSSEIKRIGGLVGDRIEEFGEQIDKRVNASEQRTAEAISQIGEQVANVAGRLQSRQDKALQTLATEIEETRKRADANLSDALTGMSDRLDQIQTQTSASLSPIQKAMASLATRLENLEDTINPAQASRDPIEGLGAEDSFIDADSLLEEFQTEDSDSLLSEDYDAEFEPGLPQDSTALDDPQDFFSDDVETENESDTVAEDNLASAPAKSAYTEDFELVDELVEPEAEPGPVDADDDFHESLTAGPDSLTGEGIDPLVDLDEYDDSHTEARESDIFEDDEFDLSSSPFEEDTPTEEEVEADAILADHSESDEAEFDPLVEEAPQEEEKLDFMSAARQAAIAASSGRPSQPIRIASRDSSSGMFSNGKLPLYAAASAVVITGAAVGGYLYLRGKQSTPSVAAAPVAPTATTSADVVEQPAAAAEDITVASMTTDADAMLFEEDTPAAVAQADPEATELETQPAPALPAPVETAQVVETAVSYAPIPAVESLATLAASGDAVAEYYVAQQYLAENNLREAAPLMQSAADKGLPIAQYTLSKLHERGTGVPKDLNLARQWTEKAAQNGNVKAMHDLAVFMAQGEGGPQSYAGAVEWFRKGAEYGIVDSQYNLGILYEQGLGISPNLTEALYWFMVAAKNGDAGAPAKVMELKASVSKEAAALAQAQTDAWTASRANGPANGQFEPQAWELGNPEQVMSIQLALTALGYQPGTPDGAVGPGTAAAIRAYQADHGLPETGTVTSGLIESLNAKAGA